MGVGRLAAALLLLAPAAAHGAVARGARGAVRPARVRTHAPRARAAARANAAAFGFADLLRDAAPYIAMHRDSAMVIHIPGEVIDRPTDFSAIMDDLALLNLLGVQLVIVVGVRSLVDARLGQMGRPSRFVGATRITDATSMRVVKEVAGFARSEVESALARGLTRISWSGSSGANSSPFLAEPREGAAAAAAPAGERAPPAAPGARLGRLDDPSFARVRRLVSLKPSAEPAEPAAAAPPPPPPPRPPPTSAEPTFAPRPLRGVEVVSSNTLFTARPIGVRNGVDFGYSGEVRKVNRESIGELLRRDWVVLMTPLGYSASGEVYNCNSHELASQTAAQLGASKLIFYTPSSWSVRAGDVAAAELAASPLAAAAVWSSLARVQSMRMLEAQALVDRFRQWQREQTADELWRQRQLSKAAKGAASPPDAAAPPPDAAAPPPDAAAPPPDAPPPPPPPPLPERASGGGGLARLFDAGGRELTIWSVLGAADGAAAAAGADEVDARELTSTVESCEAALAAGGASGARIGCEPGAQAHFVQLCAWAVRALSQGVRRAHLVDAHAGQILEELYTSAGTGLLIARDVYEGFREASVGDIPQIIELISPLEDAGILTRRGREVIEADVENGLFHVLERDGQVLACAILKPIPDQPSAPDAQPAATVVPAPTLSAPMRTGAGGGGEDGADARAPAQWAEVGCMAVNSKFQKSGRGEAMLGYLQRLALKQGVRYLFCLSTHTMQWFVERGFKEVPLTALPESRTKAYNYKRNSKCFAKQLSTSRDLDAQELFWGA